LNLISTNSASPNASVYNQLYAFWATVAAFIEQTYGLAVGLLETQENLAPVIDTNTGLTYTENFYLIFPGMFLSELSYQTYLILQGNIAALAAVSLSDYSANTGIPMPQPLVPAPVVPVAPRPPAQPVGALLPPQPNWPVRYADLSGATLPVGAFASAPDDTPVVKQGVGTPFGWSYWWTPIPAVTARQGM
jgi:hypothetical protein